jgi:hypothetical protein
MGNLNVRESGSNKVVAGAKLATAAHLLSGAAATLDSSQTDTVISAALLAIGTTEYVLSNEKGARASETWSAFACAFSLHGLLEASMFKNTFVWVATGLGLIVLINSTAAYATPRMNGRLALEAAATYGLALVAFADDSNAVLTRALGLILGATSLNVLFTLLFANSGDGPYAFATAGNQLAFGAAVIGHAAYYVLRDADDRTVFPQFVALAVAISMSSFGYRD